jgi:hypothetical protein
MDINLLQKVRAIHPHPSRLLIFNKIVHVMFSNFFLQASYSVSKLADEVKPTVVCAPSLDSTNSSEVS